MGRWPTACTDSATGDARIEALLEGAWSNAKENSDGPRNRYGEEEDAEGG